MRYALIVWIVAAFISTEYSTALAKTAEELSEDKHQGREEIAMPFPDARDQHLINKNFNKATGGK